MKKILASALLTGVLLGTAAPVFAQVEPLGEQLTDEETYDQAEVDVDTKKSGHINVDTKVLVSYTVAIPTELTVKQSDDKSNLEGTNGSIVLKDLNVAGSVDVEMVAPTLKLNSSDDSNKIQTVITTGEGKVPLVDGKISLSFEDSKIINLDPITSSTREILPGTYSGPINFTFEYNDGQTEA